MLNRIKRILFILLSILLGLSLSFGAGIYVGYRLEIRDAERAMVQLLPEASRFPCDTASITFSWENNTDKIIQFDRSDYHFERLEWYGWKKIESTRSLNSDPYPVRSMGEALIYPFDESMFIEAGSFILIPGKYRLISSYFFIGNPERTYTVEARFEIVDTFFKL